MKKNVTKRKSKLDIFYTGHPL